MSTFWQLWTAAAKCQTITFWQLWAGSWAGDLKHGCVAMLAVMGSLQVELKASWQLWSDTAK